MTKEQEEKRDRLKRWYSHQGLPVQQIVSDALICRDMHGLPDLGAAIDRMHSEWEALGNFRYEQESGTGEA